MLFLYLKDSLGGLLVLCLPWKRQTQDCCAAPSTIPTPTPPPPPTHFSQLTHDNNNNSNNNDNDERISRALFHVKHANCAEHGQIQNYKTHASKTLETAGVQTIMLKHPTKQLNKEEKKPP